MSRSHRAGGPEYNPHTGMRVNVEHTSNPLEESLRDKPVDERVSGVNFPYRGPEKHGVPYDETIPEELEGSPSKEDLTLVLPPHYVPRPHKPEPVPVKVVTDGLSERRMWQADQFSVTDGTTSAPLMIVGRQDTRHFVVVRNMDSTNAVYIGDSPNVTANTGFQIAAGTTTTRMYTTEAIYAVASSGNTVQVSVMWEYSVKV